MCWVMPPASPAATLDLRITSSKRRLAMVHVAHDGDHRRARLQVLRLVLDVQLDLLDRGVDQPAAALALFHLETEAVFGANLLRDRFVNGLVHVGKHARLHQIGDDLEGLLLELLGQLAHDDRRLDRDDRGVGGQHDLGRRRRLSRFAPGPRLPLAAKPGTGQGGGSRRGGRASHRAKIAALDELCASRAPPVAPAAWRCLPCRRASVPGLVGN